MAIKDSAKGQEAQEKVKAAAAETGRARKQKELDMWHHWDQHGRKPEHLEPLLHSIEPLLVRETSKRLAGTGGSISPNALKQNLRNAAVKQIQGYDPTAGTALSTHVVNGFIRSTDFISSQRNIKSISRTESDQYKKFHNANEELQNRLDREPTPEEMQAELGWAGPRGARRVRNMQKSFGSELSTGIDGVETTADNSLKPHTAFSVVRSGLPAEHQRFGDAYFVEDPQRIERVAKDLGISVHKARRMRASIEAKIKPVLRNQ